MKKPEDLQNDPLWVRAREPISRQESGRRGAQKRWGEPRNVRLTDLQPATRKAILALVEADRAARD